MAKNLVEKVTEKQLKNDIPEFRVGNDVIVGCKIIETKNGKSRERIQNFEGTVIARKGHGVTETFTVRKISSGIGVERIFPFASPFIDAITVNKYGRVRRARIFYLRGLTGKKARIKERRF